MNVYIHFDTTSINGLRYRMLAATHGHGTVLSHPTNHLPSSLPPVSLLPFSLQPLSLMGMGTQIVVSYRYSTAKVTPVAASFFFLLFCPSLILRGPSHSTPQFILHTPHSTPQPA